MGSKKRKKVKPVSGLGVRHWQRQRDDQAYFSLFSSVQKGERVTPQAAKKIKSESKVD